MGPGGVAMEMLISQAFGKNKRIVFFDTLLSHLNAPEIEAVLAHELGHFKRHHVIKRILWTFAMSLGIFMAAGLPNETGLVLSGVRCIYIT